MSRNTGCRKWYLVFLTFDLEVWEKDYFPGIGYLDIIAIIVRASFQKWTNGSSLGGYSPSFFIFYFFSRNHPPYSLDCVSRLEVVLCQTISVEAVVLIAKFLPKVLKCLWCFSQIFPNDNCNPGHKSFLLFRLTRCYTNYSTSS